VTQKVVIIGGGFGGLYAARRLKGAPVDLTLLDRRNFHLFQPLLYQVATGQLSPANIASPLRYILKNQANARVQMAEAVDFDLATKKVKLADGEVSFDTLVVAAGSEHNYFGHEDWRQYALGLKSVEEATEVRRKILSAFEAAERETSPEKRRAWLTFVVVGAGPTGVELAGSLAEIARDTLRHEFRSIHPASSKIILVDAVERVLPVYPAELSAKAELALSHLGVTFMPRAFVTAITADGLTFRRGTETETIASRTVLWAAGVQASSLGGKLARAAGVPVEKGGSLAVGRDLSLPGFPNVLVVGDLAQVMAADGKPLPGIAPVAIQEGKYVADLIRARVEGKTLPPFEYHHRGDMATIGRAAAVADFGRLRFDGFFAWLSWLFIHLLFLIEFEDRLLVLLQWAWNYATRNRGARLITGTRPDETKTKV